MSTEFSGPAKIYYQTKDSHGERIQIRVNLPAAVMHEIDRFLREDPTHTFLTRHHLLLNTLIYGLERLKEIGYDGLEEVSCVFRDVERIETILAEQEATQAMLDNSKKSFKEAKTPQERSRAVVQITELIDRWQSKDPDIALQLSRIIS